METASQPSLQNSAVARSRISASSIFAGRPMVD
jgi:hypothetical protein